MTYSVYGGTLVDMAPDGWDAEDLVGRPSDPESTACLIYTSGTTGAPKGVRLFAPGALLASIAQYTEGRTVHPPTVACSRTSPTAHIADRFASYYTAPGRGAHTVTCVPDHTTLYEALRVTPADALLRRTADPREN